MSTYVIGDIQGCFEELQRLLTKLKYCPSDDHLWLTGDLVNRGPHNAEVLDLAISQPNVNCLLGNHDLHFLGVATGQQTLKHGDTFQDLLKNPKLHEYIDYLRNLPLLHYIGGKNLALVHAGVPPQMSIGKCLALSGEVEKVLRSNRYENFLAEMYSNQPSIWSDDLMGMDRLRIITNYFTRMRYCTKGGQLEFTHKTNIAPEGFAPWFSFKRSDNLKIAFGHWAALNGYTGFNNAILLDTGCVWGRKLTALCIDTNTLFSVQAGS